MLAAAGVPSWRQSFPALLSPWIFFFCFDFIFHFLYLN